MWLFCVFVGWVAVLPWSTVAAVFSGSALAGGKEASSALWLFSVFLRCMAVPPRSVVAAVF